MQNDTQILDPEVLLASAEADKARAQAAIEKRKRMADNAARARKAKSAPAESIPNPYYNLGRQAGVVTVNALDLDEVLDTPDGQFAESRVDAALDEGLVPVVFSDHIRLYAHA